MPMVPRHSICGALVSPTDLLLALCAAVLSWSPSDLLELYAAVLSWSPTGLLLALCAAVLS
jgi:hypothetical protein